MHFFTFQKLNDPNVTYAEGFDLGAFNSFIDETVVLLAAKSLNVTLKMLNGILELTSVLTKQLPGFMKGHRASAYFILKNVGNLLNDDWGVRKIGPFVSAPVVDASLNIDGTYMYNEFFEGNT